jgi:hypothetical protein
MKQERVILAFIAVLIGLLAAGLAFYFYQSTKTVSPSNTTVVNPRSPSPTPKPTIYLTLQSPNDEIVVDNKTLKINGKTNPGATIMIATASDQEVIQPTQMGDFSTTTTLDNGENLIKIFVVLPDGETESLQRTVTYSTEDF